MILAFWGAFPARRRPKAAARTAARAVSPGELVTVRSLAEIASTLDADGALDGMPFMAEMARFCGRTLKVKRRADRTCVEGVGLRSLDGCVILEEAACDGSEHDGCQRGCLLFWKEAWLAPAETAADDDAPPGFGRATRQLAPSRRGARYLCQSTELARATTEFGDGWRLLARDLQTGELGVSNFAAIALIGLVNRLRAQLGLPEIGIQRGRIGPLGRRALGLKPGDWVKVKGRRSIRTALDGRGHNRGLRFEPEMTLHLGSRRQVERRVERMIDEQTGKMLELGDTVVLKGVECQGLCMKNCPRSAAMFWREAWLERAAD
jgi:hypothetical protein